MEGTLGGGAEIDAGQPPLSAAGEPHPAGGADLVHELCGIRLIACCRVHEPHVKCTTLVERREIVALEFGAVVRQACSSWNDDDGCGSAAGEFDERFDRVRRFAAAVND